MKVEEERKEKFNEKKVEGLNQKYSNYESTFI